MLISALINKILVLAFTGLSSLSIALILFLLTLLVLLVILYQIRMKEKTEFEQRFRKLVENAKDIIYTTDPKGLFDFVNDATTESSGYTKEELLGHNYKKLVREDYRHKIEAYYKRQIKDNTKESYKEFPFITRSGQTIWVGQSVLFKYNESTGEYLGAQIICRDVSERVAAEENLKRHNNDLKVINQVKEIILSSGETSNMYIKILLLLGANSDKSHFFSINILDKNRTLLHTYSFTKRDKSVLSTAKTINPKYINEFIVISKRTFNFVSDSGSAFLLCNLHQPADKYKSAVIQPIIGVNKTYGFIGFYSENEHVYDDTHEILVNDIATSLNSYFVQYEQKQIIKDYSRQLEILNESKTRLLSNNNLNDVYNSLIDLLYQEIENIYRVSIMVHDIERNIGNMIYKDLRAPDITTRILNTNTVPFIPFHLKNEVFDIPDFEKDSKLSPEAKLWYEPEVRAVYSLPIKLNNKLFASISLVSISPNSFTEQHKTIISEITESAASVIEQIKFKEIISEKNKDISDNINYAQRIQSALMPSEDMLTKILPNSFLIFSQRDSLGGDFYWYEKRGDTVFFTIGDCTGHGVSGSLLTILSMDYIKQAVEIKKYTDPALILEYLRDCLHATLNKYNTQDEIMDGLDISFGIYNSLNHTFLFSSAMHNFYHIRNNELHEYKGNRKPIGGSAIMESSYFFTTHLFHLQKNDMVYFTTDGYIDQLQLKTEKRFGKARFKQLLLQISDEDVNTQKQLLNNAHSEWKSTLSQTDDICLFGFKV